jgi:hypothetical protein
MCMFKQGAPVSSSAMFGPWSDAFDTAEFLAFVHTRMEQQDGVRTYGCMYV